MTTYVISCILIVVVLALLWNWAFPKKCKKCGGTGVMEVDDLTKNRIFRCLGCGWMQDLGRDETGGWE